MIKIGGMELHLYGLMVGLGILAAMKVAGKKAEKSLTWVVLGGIIGARLYHVVDYWSYYSRHLIEIPAVWQGGLGIFGGILGGAVCLALYAKNKKKWLELIDLIVLGLPLGQAIGRFGNYFNQELYGLATNLPWGIYIKAENGFFHPLFLYESLWCLLIFIWLRLLINKELIKVGRGEIAVTYLGFYGLGRFFLEYLRIDSWYVGQINVAQAISGSLVVASLFFWVIKLRRYRDA